jgi:hypothetical protein
MDLMHVQVHKVSEGDIETMQRLVVTRSPGRRSMRVLNSDTGVPPSPPPLPTFVPVPPVSPTPPVVLPSSTQFHYTKIFKCMDQEVR